MTSEETELLVDIKSRPHVVVGTTNLPNLNAQWNAIHNLVEQYKLKAGLQFFDHYHYEKYKCLGPYVADWGCCSASWHPSLLGIMVYTEFNNVFSS